ncbi:response regulator [Pseudodesulfovibrio cashew]|uniref:Response regulator n=1 Tax=Pseudodesulfovibrio cashew TaxID=2678688 RepID=A0A6I6JPB7_9BACT|nr:response regulator [Pseudodesulfovibrio cashew]QGY39464.1 response regulator [Pseudodesulfovibrio cashew]
MATGANTPAACLLVTQREDAFRDFLDGLTESGELKADAVSTGAQALKTVAGSPVGLVVIDEELPDFEALPLVVELIKANALVNTAVVSSLPSEEFHDKSEGYGVLRALPLDPAKEDGRELATQVVRIMGL